MTRLATVPIVRVRRGHCKWRPRQVDDPAQTVRDGMDELPLRSERRVALVVDGATDIGRAASLELGRRGYRVVVCDPDGAQANETGQRIVDGGGLAFAATARTDSVDEMRQVVHAATAR